MASNCCYLGRQGAPKWYVVGSSLKQVVCGGLFLHLFFASSTSIIAIALQIGNTYEYTVRRQTCCLSRASGVIVVVSGPSMVPVVFLAFGGVCLLHVSGWLTLVEVFAVVPLGVSCFLLCRVGEYFVAR